jgi:hypothetical protein
MYMAKSKCKFLNCETDKHQQIWWILKKSLPLQIPDYSSSIIASWKLNFITPLYIIENNVSQLHHNYNFCKLFHRCETSIKGVFSIRCCIYSWAEEWWQAYSIPSTSSIPRIVYDGHTLVYLPGRPLPLAGGTGETFSINMNSNVQVPLKSRGSYQIRLTQTSGMPVQPTDVNSLIHNQQQLTGALIATNLMQLIIRQGPNLHNTDNEKYHHVRQCNVQKEELIGTNQNEVHSTSRINL